MLLLGSTTSLNGGDTEDDPARGLNAQIPPLLMARSRHAARDAHARLHGRRDRE
jgi:hypothetical protein